MDGFIYQAYKTSLFCLFQDSDVVINHDTLPY